MNLYVLNFTLDASSLIILITLFISQLNRHKHDNQNTRLVAVMVMNGFALIAEIAGFFFSYGESETMQLFHQLAWYISFFAEGLMYLNIIVYLLYDERKSESGLKHCLPLIRFAYIFTFANLLLYIPMMNYGVSSKVNLMLGKPVENPVINELLTLSEHIVFGIYIFTNRKKYTENWITILFYCFVLCVSSSLDLLIGSLIFSNAITVYVLLIIYLNFQLDAEKRMESTELAVVESRISRFLGKSRSEFAFQVLEDIEFLALTDPDQAQSTISLLSDYLRGNIDHIDTNNMILFEDEIEHIDSYIRLSSIRHQGISIRYELLCKGFFIPSRTIYPAVEQFVRAVKVDSISETDILIKSRRDADSYIVEAIGPGRIYHHDMDQAEETYRIICSRLTLLAGASFRLYSNLNHELHAVFVYPFGDQGGEA